ncbi:MAG: indole-3-glycerol-phosphate synthase TrpC, partial [Gammaproteobacteria bacterium]|nr:indole-3-glycerol-phosphate synthase TrpC [Gammaproteobacteria bacterium]
PRAAGASGVLLIAALLDDLRLREMLRYAHRLGLFALVEIFDAADLARSVSAIRAAGPAIVDGRCRSLLGVNCRDLRSLKVDFGRFAALAPRLPADIPCVAESGVESPGQAARVAGLGYGLALVGTALMRAPDPSARLAGLLAAGRASACEARAR